VDDRISIFPVQIMNSGAWRERSGVDPHGCTLMDTDGHG